MLQNKDDKMPFDESKKQWKALIDRICSDDDFAYYFFHEKCRPLFSKILFKLYDNNADYDELVNELYLMLKKPNNKGEMWHNLRTFDYRTSLFDWIKVVAVRHFYTPSSEVFKIPKAVIETGLAEKMFSELGKALFRKYMYLKYIDSLDDDAIVAKLNLEHNQLTPLSRNAIKQFKSIVASKFPEYYTVIFSKSEVLEVDLDDHQDYTFSCDMESQQEAQIDVYQYLDAMPNKYYCRVIKALFIEDKAPEVLALEMNTPVSNIYNIKSRGLDQLRDVALFSNEICNLQKYINLVSDERSRAILSSIFIEKKNYDAVCSEMEITEVQLKKYKKDAIKEIKRIIFKARS